jgi:CheY-like chemotaxis protein
LLLYSHLTHVAIFSGRGKSLPRQPARDEEIQMNDRAILVVEDIPPILTFVKRCLERTGFRVIAAEDGLQGLAAYTRHSSVIKLVLTDVDMPNMTGAEMADRVLRDNPNLPVLFMSGNNSSADRGRACISKPFRAEELLFKVRIALKSSGTPPGETSEFRDDRTGPRDNY